MTLRGTAGGLATAFAAAAVGYGLLILVITRFGILSARFGSTELTAYDACAVLAFLVTATILGLCSIDWEAFRKEELKLAAATAAPEGGDEIQ